MKNPLTFEKQYGFEVWKGKRINSAFEFAKGYKDFISECKTEREVVDWVEKKARAEGYKDLEGKPSFAKASAGKEGKRGGRRVYRINRGKSIILGSFGKRPVKEGLRMILAHIDCPRIDLKPMPLYEAEKIAWFKTQYYGGIKKYQWPAIPLALHGVIVLENGKKITLNIGEKETDPVFTITDLLPHLSQKQMEKKLSEAVEGEEMNVVVGSKPTKFKVQSAKFKVDEGKDMVKMGILKLINEEYGITEEDLVSADLEIVPAGRARDLGFDCSMVGGYGQDDRICAYGALQAFLGINEQEYPMVLVLVDKEETGSESNTGALSNFIPDFISEMIFMEDGKHDENILRDSLSSSKAVSADVTVAFDPDYGDVFDSKNCARLGAGVAIEKYTGRRGKSDTSEASAEYLAEIRKIFNKNDILWQTGGLGKIDLGGGGTVAMFLARYNMDVIDIGVPILSMHSPFEISSKIDLYSAFESYKAIFNWKK